MRRRSFLAGAGAAVAAAAAGAFWRGAGASREIALPRIRREACVGKVLVVYGTKSGCTRGVAERIGAGLEKAGATVEVAPAQSAVIRARQEAVVVGSGVRLGKWHGFARDWVGDHAPLLRAMPVALYTVGLRIREPGRIEEVRSYTEELIEGIRLRPVGLGLFAGWNVPDRFSFLERLVIKAMKIPAGDFRDWGAIEAWATSLHRHLVQPS